MRAHVVIDVSFLEGPRLRCRCGAWRSGDTWEDAGREMDVHISNGK